MDISRSLNKLRKAVATFTVATLIASLLVIAPAHAAVPSEFSWAEDAAEALGDPEFFTSEALGADVTKCLFSQILMNALELDAAPESAEGFTDVPEWAMDAVGAMVANGIAEGRDPEAGVFGCADSMSRAEAVVMSSNAFNLCSLEGADTGSVDADDFVGVEWAMEAFECSTGLGVVNQSRPTDEMSKAESFKLVYGGMDPVNNVTEDEGDDEPAAEAGDLVVRLSGDSPAADNIPKNAFEAVYGVFVFDATDSEGDVEITNLTVTRDGLGASSNFSNVKVYSGGKQYGGEKTFTTSTNTASFNMTASPLVVPAGSLVEVEVRGDMAGGSIEGARNRVGLASADAVVSDAAAVGGTFPVYGETMTLANSSVGTLTYTHTDVTGGLEVGDSDEILGRIKLAASSVEDIVVNSLRYRNAGSSDADDFANLELRHGGDVIASSPTWDGDYAVFEFETPLEIERGNNKNLILYGDITGGIGNTVAFEVKETKDVVAYGEVYGFRVNNAESASFSPTARTISGGALNFSLAAANPPAQQVAVGDDDVEFMRFNVTTGGDAVRIEDFDLTLTPATSSASEITDIRLVEVSEDGTFGTTLAGPVDGSTTTASTAETIDFTDDWEIAAQTTTTVAVLADIDGGVSASDTFRFDIDVSGISAEYVSDSDSVASGDITPSSDVTGSVMTVAAPALTVTLSSSPLSKTVVKNATDVKVSAFNMQANTVSDITLTAVTLTQYTSGTDDYQDVSNIGLFVEEDGALTQISNSKKDLTSNASPTATFSSLNNFTIEAGDTVKVVVVADIPSSATATNSFGLGLAANAITAQDEEGTSLATAPPSSAVNNTPTVEVTIAAAGSLSAALDGDSPTSSIVSTDTDMFPVTSVKFESTNDAFEISKFEFKTDDAADSDEVESITVSYANAAGETVTLTQPVNSSGVASFAPADANRVYVPKDDDAVVEVFVNTNAEAAGADSGTTLGVDFDYDTNFEAFGEGANNRITSVGSADVAGNHHTVYATDLLVAISDDTPQSADVTEGSGQPVLKFSLKSEGENNANLIAVGVTMSGTATLAQNTATGSATLEDQGGDTEATEAYLQDASAAGGGTTTTFVVDNLDDLDGLPAGSTVIVYDDSGSTAYARKVTLLTDGSETITITPALSAATAASDTISYVPLQPGTGKLYFGTATYLGADVADAAGTITVSSINGFAIGDTVTALGATSAGAVIECTGTITTLDATTTITAAMTCTGSGTIDYDYVSGNTAVAYTGAIDEEISGTETFTVKGDLTGATPSSGSKTVQARLNAATDILWDDDRPDVGDDMDNPFENSSFGISTANLNKEKTGYSTFPLNGKALSFGS